MNIYTQKDFKEWDKQLDEWRKKTLCCKEENWLETIVAGILMIILAGLMFAVLLMLS